MTELSITERVRVEAPPGRVWRALTTPSELFQWYAPGCRWEVPSLAPGAAVRFFNSETDVQTAVVEEAVPPHRLALRWQLDQDGALLSILNTFTLASDGNATAVTIRQAGYEALAEEVQRQWLEQDRGALTSIAASLKRYVEAGRATGASPDS
jgi:uncharacterized protein YndB with AHSA1/START domain